MATPMPKSSVQLGTFDGTTQDHDHQHHHHHHHHHHQPHSTNDALIRQSAMTFAPANVSHPISTATIADSTSININVIQNAAHNPSDITTEQFNRGPLTTRLHSGRIIPRTPSKMDSFIDPNSPLMMRIHRCPLNKVIVDYKTDINQGLPKDECTIGMNKITQVRDNVCKKIFYYVFGGFNAVMWIAMILAILSYKPLGGDDPQVVSLGVAVLLMIVIILSSAFYARVDFAANKMMDSMRNMMANECLVIRNGVETMIDAVDTSLGDIVCLSLGQRVPADLRLIEVTQDLAFDRSLLTGESDPIHGSTQCTDKNFLETKNIALSSSFVTRGSAKGIVIAIGDDTVIGKMVKVATATKPKPSPIQLEIQRFTTIVSIIAFSSFSIAIILWGAWQRTRYPTFNTAGSAIINAIGCLCALVPQGLPVSFALSLSIIASKLAGAKVLVKNLSTIETLGCMSLVCSDKTGTLTTGKMTVQSFMTYDENIDLEIKNTPQNDVVNHDITNNNDVRGNLVLNALVNHNNDDNASNTANNNNTDIEMHNDPFITHHVTSLLSMKHGISSHQQSLTLATSNSTDSTATTTTNDVRARVDSNHSLNNQNTTANNITRGRTVTDATHISMHRHTTHCVASLDTSAAVAFGNNPEPASYALHRIASLCCGAVFLPQFGAAELPVEDRLVNGDPTDTAVLRFAEASKPYLGVTNEELEYSNQYVTLATIPFNSNNKFMCTVVIHKDDPNAKPLLLIKGAPDIILTKCSTVLSKRNDMAKINDVNSTPTDIINSSLTTVQLDEAVLANITQTKNEAASKGRRVIALAQLSIDGLIPAPQLDSVPEFIDPALDENNESDIEDEVEDKHNKIVTIAPPSQGQIHTAQVVPPVSITSHHIIPKARYVYPTNWEEFILQSLAQKQCSFAGCLSIMDPPRPDVPDTVSTLSRAGVSVVMVTGDFQLTAQAIARKVNIISCPQTSVFCYQDIAKLQLNWENIHTYPSDKTLMKPEPTTNPEFRRAIVLTGNDVNALSEHDWDFVCTYFHEFVFARTTPEHKKVIVDNFKERGRVVAALGDGCNDQLSLKSADIGIAMGAGADLAKDAAALVLLDNSFSSVVTGLIYGRLVFQNLRKITLFLMSTGALVEFLAVVVNVLLGMPLALSSFLQVSFCAFNDITMSISLMLEQPEGDILDAPPRDVKKDRLVDYKWLIHLIFFYGLMTFICSMGMWFYFMHDNRLGWGDIVLAFDKWTDGLQGYTKPELTKLVNQGSSVYYITMVFCNFGNLLSIRSRRTSILQSNPFTGPSRNISLFICMLISLSIALFVVHLPGLPDLVDTAMAPLKFWFIPIGFTFAIILMDELRKLIVRNFPRSPIARLAW